MCFARVVAPTDDGQGCQRDACFVNRTQVRKLKFHVHVVPLLQRVGFVSVCGGCHLLQRNVGGLLLNQSAVR
jgi:hypothetical protein